MLIPVILSGGAGTRLWPVSRRAYPKPFMRLDDGETLLEKTYARARRVAGEGAPIVTVTGRDHLFVTRDEYLRVAPDWRPRLRFLLEPSGRNTAPAVLLAALDVARRHGEDACMLVLAADHLIADVDAFAADVERAAALAAQDYLVTFGIVPTRAETGYGYILRGTALADGSAEIARFVEKPDLATAEAYVASGEYLWNSGMFCFRVGALVAAAAVTCPDVLAAARACDAAAVHDEWVVEFPKAEFAAIPETSIDYAVMERAGRRAVVSAHFDWSDIGSWQAIADLGAVDDAGNRSVGDAHVVDSRDTYVRADSRTVAVVGVDGLAVVETADAVLIAPRGRAQDVKLIVDRLRAQSHPSTEHHLVVYRPWGSYTVLEDADDCKVKRLTVKPGHVLSLQKHHRRSEHWTVVHGTAKVRVGEQEFLLGRNQSTYIPIDTVHRLENPTEHDLHLIEVQCGDYFGEDDIVRLEDRYGRVR
jgi:mannose-1-phosphate guanylyltransferase/mannose-6-phosphate isomerase